MPSVAALRRRLAMLMLAMLGAAGAGPAAAQEALSLRAARPGGAAPLRIEARLEDGGTWRFRVLDAAGRREAQRFTEETDAPGIPPRLGDADGDGAADLWVPTMTGNANTEYAIWTMRPGEGRFRRAGTVSGLRFARDPAGLLAASARNGCCAIGIAFHAFAAGDGALAEVFTIERRLREDGRPRDCVAVPADPAAAPAPPAAVVRRWCAPGLMPGQVPPGAVPIR